MAIITLTKKQETVQMAENEYSEIRNCKQIQNCSDDELKYSFEPITDSEVGGILCGKGLLIMSSSTTTIYLKTGSRAIHVEAFGIV